MRYLDDTEYYPGAIRFFFDRILQQRDSGGGTLERLLSTHPLPEDRVEKVEQRLREMGDPQATEENTFSRRYARFKQRLP